MSENLRGDFLTRTAYSVTSALEVSSNEVRYINRRFTYLLSSSLRRGVGRKETDPRKPEVL